MTGDGTEYRILATEDNGKQPTGDDGQDTGDSKKLKPTEQNTEKRRAGQSQRKRTSDRE